MKYLMIVFIVILMSGCAKPKQDDWNAILSAPSPRYAPMPIVIINTPQPFYRGEYPAFNNLYQNTQNNPNRNTYITPCLSGNCY